MNCIHNKLQECRLNSTPPCPTIILTFPKNQAEKLTHVKSLFHRKCCVLTDKSCQRGRCYQLGIGRLEDKILKCKGFSSSAVRCVYLF